MKKLTAVSGSLGGCIVAAVLALVSQNDHKLKTSPQGLAFIANLEGCENSAYQCSADVWTIGLGHTSDTKAGDMANTEEIADWFIEDVATAEKYVERYVNLPASPKFDMAVSFVMNLGVGNFRSSTFLTSLQSGTFDAACYEFLRWVYVNGKDCRKESSNCAGIVKRRLAEKEICLNGY